MSQLHDPIVEKQVLGICYNFSHWPEGLEPKHFGSPALASAYRAHLNKELIDTPIVAEKHQYTLEYALSAIDESGTDSMLSKYVEKVLELHARREAVRKANDTIKAANDLNTSLEELGIEVENHSFEIITPKQFSDQLPDALKGIKPLRTRFDVANSLLETLTYGEIAMICGRPGTGKTAFGMQLFENICEKQGEKGICFSLEMDGKALIKRKADEAYYEHFKDDDFYVFLNSRNRWYNSFQWDKKDVYYSFKKLHVKQFRSKIIAAIKMDPNIKNVLVDHMKLVKTDKETKFDGYAEFTWELAEVAKEFGLRCFLLNQTKKSEGSFKKGTPITMNESFGGGDPLENIHYFVGLYVDNDGDTCVSIDKSRSGALVSGRKIGKIGVYFENYGF